MCRLTTLIIVQARMGSTRLPGKVMKRLAGLTMIEHIMRNLSRVKRADYVVLATSTNLKDDPLVNLAEKRGWLFFRGSELNVLERFVGVVETYPCDTVVRVTADCPLIDPRHIDRLIAFHVNGHYDYCCMRHAESNLPRGLGAESISAETLKNIYGQSDLDDRHREHVTLYVKEHPEKYRIGYLPNLPELERPTYRLTVDTREDFELISRIYGELYQGKEIPSEQVVTLLDKRPDLASINKHIKQKPV